MLKANTKTIIINLIRQRIIPEEDEFNLMVVYFSNLLFKNLNTRKLKTDYSSYVHEAIIKIEVDFKNNYIAYTRLISNVLKCKIEIEDDRRKIYHLEKEIWCSEHSKRIESKSAREYDQGFINNILNKLYLNFIYHKYHLKKKIC